MGIWLDFVQVALALSVGWMGWVLWQLARTQAAPHAPRQQRDAARQTAMRPAAVISRRVRDGER